jgi:hypothetical protein
MLFIRSATLLLLATIPIPAFGSQTFTVQIDTPTSPFVAGSTNNIMSVWAFTSLPSSPSLNLNSFSLGFDFGSTGVGVTGFSNISVVRNAAVFQSTSLITDTNRLNYDFRVSGQALTQSSLVMTNFNSSNRLKLFDLKFDIDATAGGTYGFKFVTALTTDGNPPNRSNSLSGGLASGSTIFNTWVASGNSFVASGTDFNVQAIPEPTTITLLAIGLAGGVACRRFRKRSSSVGPGTTDPSTNEAKV